MVNLHSVRAADHVAIIRGLCNHRDPRPSPSPSSWWNLPDHLCLCVYCYWSRACKYSFSCQHAFYQDMLRPMDCTFLLAAITTACSSSRTLYCLTMSENQVDAHPRHGLTGIQKGFLMRFLTRFIELQSARGTTTTTWRVFWGMVKTSFAAEFGWSPSDDASGGKGSPTTLEVCVETLKCADCKGN